MRHLILSAIIFLGAAVFGCETRQSRQEQAPDAEAREQADIPAIKVTPYEETSEYPDAILEMHAPGDYESVSGPSVEFTYDVKNFPAAMEASAPYLTVNLNNEFFYERSEPAFAIDLPNGDYAALSFLTLENHISLKNYGNYVFRRFAVGGQAEQSFDEEAPALFYHYPRGDFREGETIPLDFYLINADLARDGYKIKLEIGKESFTLDKWQAYRIENLPKGRHEIRISLTENNGAAADSPFATAAQTIRVY